MRRRAGDQMREAKLVDPVSVPVCDFADPGSLEAWYGNFGFFGHWREVVLANCYEIERAKAILAKEPGTEAQLKNLALTNPIYCNFLTVHLNGRRVREKNVLASYGR